MNNMHMCMMNNMHMSALSISCDSPENDIVASLLRSRTGAHLLHMEWTHGYVKPCKTYDGANTLCQILIHLFIDGQIHKYLRNLM